MIRELVSRINTVFVERRASPRKKFSISVKVWFAPEHNTANLSLTQENVFLAGETRDVSPAGIGFVVASIRIKEKYLVGQDRILNVELDLPRRKVRMQVVGRRYERVGIHVSTEKYLVGAEIVNMIDSDREVYEDFLKNGKKYKGKTQPSYELGLD